MKELAVPAEGRYIDIMEFMDRLIRRRNLLRGLPAALALVSACAVLAPAVYSNYYIPAGRMLTETGREGRLPDTPRIFVQEEYLYVRPESFDMASDRQARQDAYEDMMLVYDKITGVRKVGRYAEKAGEMFIFLRTPYHEERVATEALYALPLSRFDAALQKNLRCEYDESLADTKPAVVRAEPDTLLERFRRSLYINPVLSDSLKVTRILSWYPFSGRDVYTGPGPDGKEIRLYVRACSGLADTRSGAEHAAETHLSRRLEEVAVRPVVMQTAVAGMLLVKATDVLGREGFVMELLFSLPLGQFPAEIRNRLKINY